MSTIEFLRQFRIGGYAVFDFAISLLAIYFISPFFTKILRKVGFEVPLMSWLLFTLPMSIGIHLIVQNMTSMTKDFLDPSGHYIVKGLIISLFIFGMMGVRRKSS